MKLNQYLSGACLILSLATVSTAHAAGKWYLPDPYYGLGIDGLDLEAVTPEGGALMGSTERDMNGFNLRLGVWFPLDIIGIELRGGNVAEESGTVFGDPQTRYAFLLGKVNLPFERVSLYVMGGISRVKYDFNGTTDTEDDVVGGFGIELMGTETTGLTLEFLRYGVDEANIEGEIITLGYNHRFDMPGFR